VRFNKKVQLTFNQIYDNRQRGFVICIATFLSVLFAVISYQFMWNYKMALDRADMLGMSNRIYIKRLQDSMFTGHKDSTDEYRQIIDEIRSVNGVADVEELAFPELSGTKDGIKYTLVDYSSVPDFEYDLVKGRWPTDKNQVVLTNNAMKYFNVGDTLSFDDYLFEITGFIDSSVPRLTFYSGSNPVSLYPYFAETFEEYVELQETTCDVYIGGYFLSYESASGLKSEDIKINLAALAVVLDGTVDSDVVLNEIQEKFEGLGVFESGKLAIANYKEQNLFNFILCCLLMVCAVTLLFGIVLSDFYVNVVLGKREFSVYRINGASWKDCVLVICASYLFPVIIGCLFSVSSLILLESVLANQFDYSSHKYFECVGLSIIFIIALNIICFFLLSIYARKTKIVDSYNE